MLSFAAIEAAGALVEVCRETGIAACRRTPLRGDGLPDVAFEAVDGEVHAAEVDDRRCDPLHNSLLAGVIPQGAGAAPIFFSVDAGEALMPQSALRNRHSAVFSLRSQSIAFRPPLAMEIHSPLPSATLPPKGHGLLAFSRA